jgi:GNAT superfamily N-acetyltransferase
MASAPRTGRHDPMFPLDRLRVLRRFVRQEGIASATFRTVAQVAGLVYRSETAYILARPITRKSDAPPSLQGVTIELLREEQIDQLAKVGYSKSEEIARRMQNGQICIVAKRAGEIVHYSWLTSKDEYAEEIEMTIPVETSEAYLYNCRTLSQVRGMGIFPAIIARAIDEAGRSGASVLIALVSKNNKSSLRAFDKMRFKVRQETTLIRFLSFRKHHSRKHNNDD